MLNAKKLSRQRKEEQWLAKISKKLNLPQATKPNQSLQERTDSTEDAPIALCVLEYQQDMGRAYFSAVMARRNKRRPEKFVAPYSPIRTSTLKLETLSPEDRIVVNAIKNYTACLHLTLKELTQLIDIRRIVLFPIQNGVILSWNDTPKMIDLEWVANRNKVRHHWFVKDAPSCVVIQHVQPWVYLDLKTGEVGNLIYPEGVTPDIARLIDEAPAIAKSKIDSFSDQWERTFGDLFPSPRKGRRFTEVDATLDEIHITENASNIDWFDFKSTLKAGEHHIDMPDLATEIFEQYGEKDWPDTYQYRIPNTDIVAKINLTEIAPILRFTINLLNRHHKTTDEEGHATVLFSRHDFALIEELPPLIREQVSIGSIREVLDVLRTHQGHPPLAPIPDGLNAQLRPYQHEGYSWLQFWRSHGLHGILADDMGLGKTLQVITHLLREKEQERLTQPALIVVPASLLGNWRNEIQRFAPLLREKVWHGTNRKSDKSVNFSDYDVIITTYALALRDEDILQSQKWSILVLDEAQNIKNKKSLAGRSLKRFIAEQRLCLSGTPMENHLGELWALFDFLMPGFLGSSRTFARFFRSPIEKDNDHERLDKLRRWIKPFMIRRTKNEVATELPPKNEIIQTLPLGKAQSQAYEAVRVAMQDKIIQALSSKGLSSSYITVLDALLKLRQVCCDPTLLNVPETANINESVKLDWLRETLPELIEEGRRILIFSQFVQMLKRIEPVLNELGIPYTMLTGETQNREAVIQRFRKEAIPVFLISLKAGGVGLNLTEADTVILFDPWWNPAVEAQAIDRTHRIGQDKPVFIYKLITEGTVEQKIMDLQNRKRMLFNGALSESETGNAPPLTEEEIKWLFAR